jgi:5-(carboxyamino)imidazole ribonucleotide synthase
MNIGIIGAGQLGRMLALAGYPLGLRFHFLDRGADTPGGQVAPIAVGEFEDRARLRELDAAADVVTFDWENISVAALEVIPAGKIRPPAAALATSQDRLLEKQLFRELRIPTPAFAPVDSRADLLRAAQRIGMPGVLKTRRFGYDGKGQAVIRSVADAGAAWTQLGTQPLLYEAFVNFTAEVSIIGARSTRGEIAIYPLSANTHSGGILRHTIAPFARPSLARLAQRYLRAILRRFGYAGVLTIEFFVVGGKLLANEMAPRVHNSGHWTIEGAHTSQFENHLRAILGWPLGSTAPRGHAAMINFIGALPEREHWLGEPGLHFHDYGKAARPNRKVGHCTLVEPSAARRDLRLRRLLVRLGSQPGSTSRTT